MGGNLKHANIKLNNIDKKIAILLFVRFAGVAVSAVTHFVSIKVFVKQFPQISAEMVSVYNWLGIVPIIQLGFGKPIYSKIRFEHHAALCCEKTLNSARRLMNQLAFVAIVVYVTLSASVIWGKMSITNLVSVIVFSIGIGIQSLGLYQKDVAYAISKEMLYESTELARRSLLLVGIILLSFGVNILIVGGVEIVFGLILFNLSNSVLYSTVTEGYDEQFVSNLWTHARKCFVFSFSEYLIYNSAFVYCLINNLGSDLIYVVVWNRVYQIIVLPMRMFIESRLNQQTLLFYSKSIRELKRSLEVNAVVALFSVVLMILLSIKFNKNISAWLNVQIDLFNPVIFLSFFLWAGANAIQHTYASFLMSQTCAFDFGLKISGVFLGITWIIMLVAVFVSDSIKVALAVNGFSMVLMAILYLQRTNMLIRIRN